MRDSLRQLGRLQHAVGRLGRWRDPADRLLAEEVERAAEQPQQLRAEQRVVREDHHRLHERGGRRGAVQVGVHADAALPHHERQVPTETVGVDRPTGGGLVLGQPLARIAERRVCTAHPEPGHVFVGIADMGQLPVDHRRHPSALDHEVAGADVAVHQRRALVRRRRVAARIRAARRRSGSSITPHSSA